MGKVDREEDIARIIERVTARESLELVHWEAVGPPGRLLLRIYIDKPGGVTIEDCANVSNQVGLILDMEDAISARYTLEVSSPGVERPLYKPADYQRFAGSRIKLRMSEPIDGQRNFRGILVGIENNVVRLEADGHGLMEIPYPDIAKANLEFQF